MSRKQKIIIISASAALLVLIVLGIIFFVKGKKKDLNDGGTAIASQSDKRRDNTLKLIERYLAQGEYDRALDLIDRLLIENPDDEEANELQQRILMADRHKDSDGGLTELQRQMLEEQRRQNDRIAANMQKSMSSSG